MYIMIRLVKVEPPSRKETPKLDAFLKVLAVLGFIIALLMFFGYSIPILSAFTPLF